MQSTGASGFAAAANEDQEREEYEPKLSLLEQEYMEKARIRQKEGIVKPQIVAGREFKGTAFISKPDKIIFKDFTVGVSHTQTILMTNVSFSFSSFKLLPLEDKIKDFFHIQYTPSGRMSAGLSTTITITFTPQLNEDINSVFPILSETGRIDIPLICTCKKALIEVEQPAIDFGNVIFGEQNTQYLRIVNKGALPTKIYVKAPDGTTIPFVSVDDVKQKERQRREDARRPIHASAVPIEEDENGEGVEGDGSGTVAEGGEENKQSQPSPAAEAQNQSLQDAMAVQSQAADMKTLASAQMNSRSSLGTGMQMQNKIESTMLNSFEQIEEDNYQPTEADIFDEFLAQVSFKRTTEIDGYSSTKIQFTFIPMKLTEVSQRFTLFLENQDYTKPIPITVQGTCVDVPIYVEKEEYNLNVLVYEQFYREKIILHNRGANAMKIQLTFPKDFKPYLEFNPTLGFIQGNGSFEIWSKLKPDRSILQTCSRFLVKQNEEPPKDEYEEFTMRIPIKVTGANQVLPVKFSLLCVFTVNAITFTPSLLDFGSIFNQTASRCTLTMENHSLLPQQFSFVRLPKEIRVATDHGTGTILPQEKYELQVEYRPSQAQVFEEANIFVRLITGEACVREVKLPYLVNVTKCPITSDKYKVEFPCLPEGEFAESVIELTNTSQKNFTIEVVPPSNQLSGLTVNPLVKPIEAGKSTLVSVKFDSRFRDLTYKSNEDMRQKAMEKENAEEGGRGTGLAKMGRNRKLEEKIRRQKEERGAAAGAVDPKAKGKAPAKEAKKEDAKAAAGGKPVKKTQQQIEEEEAEEERLRKEAEEAEIARLTALEAAFDRTAVLKSMGGRVTDFEIEDELARTQHYDWLLPVYFRSMEPGQESVVKTLFLEVRTTTVPKTLVANTDCLDFGEIPVAFKKTQEILVKNVGRMEETLRLQSLTPFGGFSVLNAMRTIKPGETKPIVVQFEPLFQQIQEERVVMFSDHTMVSVNLKGTGVRPEVKITPEDGILPFGNVLQGETAEKTFSIQNVSSFPVNFDLESQARGVENHQKQVPFVLIPKQGTIPANESYEVKIVFQPDHVSNDYFDVLLIDIPNQINAKKIYLRGQCYPRQVFVREYKPHEWRPLEEIQGNYDQPLLHLNPRAEPKQTILLEYLRDEDAKKYEESNPFLFEQDRIRSIVIGNCRLLDTKLEKNGAFEFVQKSQDTYFECDNPKGAVNGGQELVVKFTFKPPSIDPLLQDIGALKGIGQWVESVWECKLSGGYIEPGTTDAFSVDVILRAYVEQI